MADRETWIKYIARTGYASKTVLYIMLGVIVVSSAFTAFSSSSPDQKTVFAKILEQPFGRYMLIAVIAGMVCYSLWRWIQCFLNTEDLDMQKFKDIVMRAFLFISGILYFLGAYAAIKILMGQSSDNGSSNGGSGDNSSENIAAQLMEQSWGGYVVMALGAIIVIFAFIQFKHAWKSDFMDKFVTQNMSSKEIEASEKAGRVGYLARGVIYTIIGIFFLQAGWSHDPEEAGGLKEAFQSLMEQPFGDWLLMAVGIGIVLFGVFCGFEALYRQTAKQYNPTR